MEFLGLSSAKLCFLALVGFLGLGSAWAELEGDVAMVTSIQGGVSRVATQGLLPIQSFVKLKQGEVLKLEPNARLLILYFAGGRHETWGGNGRLEITEVKGIAHGLAQPTVKLLPATVAKQISRTPSLHDQGRSEIFRMRTVVTPDAIVKMEKTYKQLRRKTTDQNDINPELYLLSGLFEMRELDRVEQILGRLQRSRPGNPEVGLIVALYRKSVKNAREANSR